jgi:hypothetical protein
MELNWTHQHLIYTDDVTLLNEQKYKYHKNTKPLLVTSKKVCLGASTQKTKHTEQSHINTATKSF